MNDELWRNIYEEPKKETLLSSKANFFSRNFSLFSGLQTDNTILTLLQWDFNVITTYHNN